MSSHWINRAAIGLDAMIAHITDRLSGNLARRKAIREKAFFAMLSNEHRSLIKARAEQNRRLGSQKYRSHLMLRADYHRSAV